MSFPLGFLAMNQYMVHDTHDNMGAPSQVSPVDKCRTHGQSLFLVFF